MSLQQPKTITDVFAANGLTTGFACMLLQSQELALAVNIQRRYAVLFETTQHGIFCNTWLAQHSATHDSHRRFDCFYESPARRDEQLAAIYHHLAALLAASAGGAE